MAVTDTSKDLEMVKAAKPEPGVDWEKEQLEAKEAAIQEKIMQWGLKAKQALRYGGLIAAGYRVVVKPIEIVNKLEGAMADQAPTLAGKGFEQMTEKEKDRHQRSENRGVVISIGPIAFKRLGEPWCKEGDVVVFSRHAGTRVEHPPGSNNFFQIVNDEDIMGTVEL